VNQDHPMKQTGNMDARRRFALSSLEIMGIS
jgi:hypothetical protein